MDTTTIQILKDGYIKTLGSVEKDETRPDVPRRVADAAIAAGMAEEVGRATTPAPEPEPESTPEPATEDGGTETEG